MTRKDALELLELSADATAEEIGRQYAHQFSDYQIRLTNAPTPALKRLYQRNLAELEEAYALLASTPEEVVIGDLPTAEPSYSGSHRTPTRPMRPSRPDVPAPRDGHRPPVPRPTPRPEPERPVRAQTDPTPERGSRPARPSQEEPGRDAETTPPPHNQRVWLAAGGVAAATVAVFLLAGPPTGDGADRTTSAERTRAGETAGAGVDGSARGQAPPQSKVTGTPPVTAGGETTSASTSSRAIQTPIDSSALRSASRRGAQTPDAVERAGAVEIVGPLPSGVTLRLNGRLVEGVRIPVPAGRLFSIVASGDGYTSDTLSGRGMADEVARWTPAVRKLEPAVIVAPADSARRETTLHVPAARTEPAPLTSSFVDAGRGAKQASESSGGSPPARPDADRAEVTTLVEAYLTMLRRRDTSHVVPLFRTPTRDERDIIDALRRAESRFQIVRQTVGAPALSDTRATVEFTMKFSWRSAFGAGADPEHRFRAELERGSTGWRMTSVKIVPPARR